MRACVCVCMRACCPWHTFTANGLFLSLRCEQNWMTVSCFCRGGLYLTAILDKRPFITFPVRPWRIWCKHGDDLRLFADLWISVIPQRGVLPGQVKDGLSLHKSNSNHRVPVYLFGDDNSTGIESFCLVFLMQKDGSQTVTKRNLKRNRLSLYPEYLSECCVLSTESCLIYGMKTKWASIFIYLFYSFLNSLTSLPWSLINMFWWL